MKVQNNFTIFAGAPQSQMYTENTQNAHDSEPKKAFYAGGFQGDLSLQERIAQRKEQAKKQAFKIVSDAWEGEQKIEDALKESRERIQDLKRENKEAENNLKDIREQREALKAEYGITDDSEEEKELELLRRKQKAMEGKGELTEEEWKRSLEMEAGGLTEYQQRQLELDKFEEHNQEIIEENDRAIRVENAVIRGIKEERRKVHPMLDARKQAEAVEESASREIIGMVVEDTKEKLDEEQEAREEKAEVIEEKREEQEALIEARREEKQELEELTEEIPLDGMLEMEQLQSKVQAEVENLVNRMKLVAEDIKGAAVDTNV